MSKHDTLLGEVQTTNGPALDRLSHTGVPLDVKNWDHLCALHRLDIADDPERLAKFDNHNWSSLKTKVGFWDRLHPVWDDSGLHASDPEKGWTTRMVSRGAYVQGIPKGRMRQGIRSSGNLILTADWSGSQLRILADASGDQAMNDDIRQGDIYGHIASDIGLDSVTDRKRVKDAILACLYGQGWSGRVQTLPEFANRLPKYLDRRWPDAMAFLRGLREKARTDLGVLITPDGTKVRIPVSKMHNAAVGYIQALEADALRRAVKLLHDLEDSGVPVKLVMTVHDEIVCEVTSPNAIDDVSDDVERAMTDALGVHPALRQGAVKVAWGPSWGQQDFTHTPAQLPPLPTLPEPHHDPKWLALLAEREAEEREADRPLLEKHRLTQRMAAGYHRRYEDDLDRAKREWTGEAYLLRTDPPQKPSASLGDCDPLDGDEVPQNPSQALYEALELSKDDLKEGHFHHPIVDNCSLVYKDAKPLMKRIAKLWRKAGYTTITDGCRTMGQALMNAKTSHPYLLARGCRKMTCAACGPWAVAVKAMAVYHSPVTTGSVTENTATAVGEPLRDRAVWVATLPAPKPCGAKGCKVTAWKRQFRREKAKVVTDLHSKKRYMEIRDHFSSEPPSTGDPFGEHSYVLITPAPGAQTPTVTTVLMTLPVKSKHYIDGPNPVDPDALKTIITDAAIEVTTPAPDPAVQGVGLAPGGDIKASAGLITEPRRVIRRAFPSGVYVISDVEVCSSPEWARRLRETGLEEIAHMEYANRAQVGRVIPKDPTLVAKFLQLMRKDAPTLPDGTTDYAALRWEWDNPVPMPTPEDFADLDGVVEALLDDVWAKDDPAPKKGGSNMEEGRLTKVLSG